MWVKWLRVILIHPKGQTVSIMYLENGAFYLCCERISCYIGLLVNSVLCGHLKCILLFLYQITCHVFFLYVHLCTSTPHVCPFVCTYVFVCRGSRERCWDAFLWYHGGKLNSWALSSFHSHRIPGHPSHSPTYPPSNAKGLHPVRLPSLFHIKTHQMLTLSKTTGHTDHKLIHR